jgi:hypothetical protein
MVAAMQGRRNADKLRAKRDLLIAYHTGAFAGAAFAGKLKPLDQYVSDGAQERPLQYAHAIAFFHRMKARGFPVEITRTVN